MPPIVVAASTVWCRCLPTRWSEQQLLKLFNTVDGVYSEWSWNVVACNFAYRDVQDLGIKVGNGQALFLYATPELALYAVGRLNGLLKDGRRIDVRISTRSMDFKRSRCVLVRGQTRTGLSLWDVPPGPLDPR